MGFYAVIASPFGAMGDDYDDEWDVDYDYDTFEFATIGHPDQDSAWTAAVSDRGIANPGSTRVYRLADTPRECANFDRMAETYLATRTPDTN